MDSLVVSTTLLVLYLVWAVVLSDSLFHRVFSLALFALFVLMTLICTLTFSAYTIPLSVLAFLDLMLCVALSPAQAIFHRTRANDLRRRSLEVFSRNSTSNGALEGAIIAELVLLQHYFNLSVA